MDEVHVERLIQRYRNRGEIESEDPALVMLKQWPASKQFKENPEKLPGLEQQVCNYKCLMNAGTHLSFLYQNTNLF